MSCLLFLDIDGVLNNPGCYDRFSKVMSKLTLEEARIGMSTDVNAELLFDFHCVKLLNEITDATDARIVLSSSWRMMYWHKRDRFNALAKRVGIKAPIIDFTPQRMTGQRGHEIRSWLIDNRTESQIVILDDDDDMDIVRKWFVRTNGAVGLTEANRDEAITKLQGPGWRQRK